MFVARVPFDVQTFAVFFMNHLARPIVNFLTMLCLCFAPGLAAAASYEAPLPVQLSTDPDLCAYVPCKDVMPGADSFSPRMGKPAYVEAYQTRRGQHEGQDGHGGEKNGGEKSRDDHDG